MLTIQKLHDIKNRSLLITNSRKYANKHDKKTKGWLLIFSYAILFGIIAFVASLVIASIIGSSVSGEYIAAQLFHQFGYVNASKAVAESASFNLRVTRWSPIVIPLIVASIGAIYGYLKGKNAL